MPLKKVISKLGMEEPKGMTVKKLSAIMVTLMDKFGYDLYEKDMEANEDEENEYEAGQFKYPYKQLLIWSTLLLR